MGKNRSRAVKVSLRFRKLNTGKESLYLDFYPPITDPETGKPSRREYLGMIVSAPTKDRKGNLKYSDADNDTIKTAEIVRNNRQAELYKADIYTDAEREMIKAKERGNGDFIAYFKKLANEKKTSNHDNWLSALAHLQNYLKLGDNSTTIRFCDITLEWCEGYKNYLLSAVGRSNGKQLKTNTAASYFVKFKIALKAAFKFGYLSKDLNADLKSIKEQETVREFVTLDELHRLVQTPCNDEVLKRAALFSALTGLRHSDIRKMVWGEIVESKEGLFSLKYTMQKTGKYSELPISSEAVELCGERNSPDRLVFYGMKPAQYNSKALS